MLTRQEYWLLHKIDKREIWQGSDFATKHRSILIKLQKHGYISWQPLDNWRSLWVLTNKGRTAID